MGGMSRCCYPPSASFPHTPLHPLLRAPWHRQATARHREAVPFRGCGVAHDHLLRCGCGWLSLLPKPPSLVWAGGGVGGGERVLRAPERGGGRRVLLNGSVCGVNGAHGRRCSGPGGDCGLSPRMERAAAVAVGWSEWWGEGLCPGRVCRVVGDGLAGGGGCARRAVTAGRGTKGYPRVLHDSSGTPTCSSQPPQPSPRTTATTHSLVHPALITPRSPPTAPPRTRWCLWGVSGSCWQPPPSRRWP